MPKRTRSLFRNLFRKRAVEQSLADELRSSVEILTQEKTEQGFAPSAARRAAMIELGGVEQVKEATRQAWAGAWLTAFGRDLAYGLRQMRRNPGFVLTAVVILALGIGANTAVFSLTDAVMLGGLSVRHPQNIYLLDWHAKERPRREAVQWYPGCKDFGCAFPAAFAATLHSRASIPAVAGATIVGAPTSLLVAGIAHPAVASTQFVAGNYFNFLGVRTVLGRPLEPADDRPGAPIVAVISYAFWTKAFGGSPKIVGKIVNVNQLTAAIIGVTPPGFAGATPGFPVDFWLPNSAKARLFPRLAAVQDDNVFESGVLVRTAHGAAISQAAAALSARFAAQRGTLHQALFPPGASAQITLLPVNTTFALSRKPLVAPLTALTWAVGILLLIACANLAGLQLARFATRQREFAVRMALGAGGRRLVRQLFAESLLLAVLGGGLGLLLAWDTAQGLARLAMTADQRLVFPLHLDLRVLGISALATLLATLLFGLAPALRTRGLDLNRALKDSAGSTLARARRRFSLANGLIVLQVGLSLVLLAGAGLLVRTLRDLRRVDPGFDTNHLLVFDIPADYGKLHFQWVKLERISEELRHAFAAIPGIKGASYSSTPVLAGGTILFGFTRPDGKYVTVLDLEVGPDYFATMGIPLFLGRDFGLRDLDARVAWMERMSKRQRAPADQAPEPIIVNQAFVKRYLAGREPVGAIISYHHGPGFEIVGVVGDMKYRGPRSAVAPIMYQPFGGSSPIFTVRTAGNPMAELPAIRAAVRRVASGLPVLNPQTETEIINRTLVQPRLLAELSSLFAAFALMLACLGLYGLLSQDVARRTRELGIRMALGAGNRDLLRMVLLRGLVLTAAGALAGLAAAAVANRFLTSLLYGVRPTDPGTLVAVIVLLLIVAACATLIPARRAARTDPLQSLRYE